MGFFSSLFSVTSCHFCGSSDLMTVNQFSDCKLLACKRCNKVGVYNYAPKCCSCGKAMRGTTYHSGGAIVPKCTSCGHVYDADEIGWIKLD